MVVVNSKIETYTISVSTTKSGSQKSRRREINLASEVLSHGIQTRFRLFFATSLPVVLGVQTTPNYFQHDATVYLPLEEYELMYDLLRNEAPVTARYGLENNDVFSPITANRFSFMTFFSLTTGDEIPGEGPVDEDADPDELIAQITRRFSAAPLTAG